jgi:hypothetical protein
MDIIDYIYKLLEKGLFLKVYFIDSKNKKKYIYLMNSDWINLLNIYDKKFEKNKIIDICLDKTFSFKNKKPYSIQYMYVPENFDQNLLNNLDLKNDETYIINISESILDVKLLFSNYLSFYKLKLHDINNDKTLDANQLILITYPKYKDCANNAKKIKYNIIKKFFTSEENLEKNIQTENYKNILQSEDYNFLNTFNLFGINIKNKNVTDPIFLNALRERWCELIKNEKNKVFNKLKEEDFLNEIQETERDEYIKELMIYKENLFKSDMENLNKLKTVKEIISYWPSILFPIPSFVYNEY